MACASTPVGAARAPHAEVVVRWLVIEQPLAFASVTDRTTFGADRVNVIAFVFVTDVMTPPVIPHAYVLPTTLATDAVCSPTQGKPAPTVMSTVGVSGSRAAVKNG